MAQTIHSEFMPTVGTVLQRKVRSGEVFQAKVITVDLKSKQVCVEFAGQLYPSLSAAANAATGGHHNGWRFWGLKKAP